VFVFLSPVGVRGSRSRVRSSRARSIWYALIRQVRDDPPAFDPVVLADA
jgi:hypothetical protein